MSDDPYHRASRERDALAVQLAHEWGWPDAESVLTRLRGDRTAALTTFTEHAYGVFLGVRFDLGPDEGGGLVGGSVVAEGAGSRRSAGPLPDPGPDSEGGRG